MYARVDQILKVVGKEQESRPLILCEYCHSMGNSTGNIHKYWKAFNAHERLQGGFIWDWVDQGLKRTFDETTDWLYGGDFGDTPNDAQFCINGLVFPDRIPHPAVAECKRVQTPVTLEFTPDRKSIIIRNIAFHPLDGLEAKWQVYRNGVACSDLCGSFLVPTLPGQDEWSTVNPSYQAFTESENLRDSEVAIHVAICQSKATRWSPPNFILYSIDLHYNQGVGKPAKCFQIEDVVASSGEASREDLPLRLTQSEKILRVESPCMDVHFSLESGRITDWKLKTSEADNSIVDLICTGQGPSLNMFRACTDNDCGGSFGTSFASRWDKLGIGSMSVSDLSVKVTDSDEDRVVVIRVSEVLRPKAPVAENEEDLKSINVTEVGGIHWFGKDDESEGDSDDVSRKDSPQEKEELEPKDVFVEVLTTYTIRPQEVEVEYTVDLSRLRQRLSCQGQVSPSVPRLGVHVELPELYRDVSWYGSGPHECYPDRKDSGLIKTWSGKVRDFPVKYIVPSESGGRTDVRWAAVSSDAWSLLCFPVGSSTFELLNASPYSQEDVQSAKHWSEINPSGTTHLYLDHRHMGVGGDDSWTPCTHEEYLIPPDKYTFGVRLVPTQKSFINRL
jgi:beta-galactosidase